MFCCRAGHSVWRRALSLWYTKEPIIYQRIEGDVTIVESVSIDKTITKCKIWDSGARLLDPSEAADILYTKVDSPWLWVGAEGAFGDIDMTGAFQAYLVEGNKITLKFLEAKFPDYGGWKYLDPVTFKEVEFPDLGITIDDPRVERHSEENKENQRT